ncbi:aspartate/glutamate racemase family protein [Thermococcus sp.]|uniref:aspartate/glutamate racemase family protein n=1 Tax=Thermococcus sp. TaxID=35749 RepID=UPI0019B53BBF|nr:aspartate/glutamate racemase family protein [Thermococcus sp.]MBC7094460.1 aspartate/glutamate racemase family protein [Thermococcus sp.]
MKILVINPVGTSRWNETDKKIYQSFASPETEIDVVSLDEGPISIETRKTEAEAIPRIVETALKNHESYDAIIVNCCADPGVDIIRSLIDKPVIGPCESSLAISSTLGKKIGIVTVSKTGIPIFEELVRKLKFEELVVSIRATDLSVPEIEKDRDKTVELLLKECKKSEEEGAEVILLGCTGFAGFAKELEKHLSIPVIDPVGAATKMAETLVSLRLHHSKKRYFS